MGDSIDGEGFKARISEDNFLNGGGCWVSIKSGFGVFLKDGADGDELVKEGFDGFCGVEVLDGGEVDALADLRFEALGKGSEPVLGDGWKGVAGDAVFAPESGEEEMKEVFSDGCDASFGGKVYAVDVVDAAVLGIGIEEGVAPLLKVHGESLREDGVENQP
jgi:hypothetical protein